MERDYPGLTREHCILIGRLAAGMDEAILIEFDLGRHPNQTELELAIDYVAKYIKSYGYFTDDHGFGSSLPVEIEVNNSSAK